ncbi:MAG: BON domain-containing protein [Alphaproteobacteria bacterium]|nr:BON domain-containing protein [Alphaproteobacteria bacterium]
MRNDTEILHDVTDALEYAPGLDIKHILIEVTNGIIKLKGSVHSPAEKWTAKEAIKHVQGVRGIIDELEITPTTHI